MDIYMMQYKYRSRYLVVISENTYFSVYTYEKNKFDQPFLSFQAKSFFIGNLKVCQTTKFSELWITLTSMVMLFC